MAVRQLFPTSAEVTTEDAYGATPRIAPPNRPWVLANMIVSVDGAITVAGSSGGLGGPADRLVFPVVRSLADVILVAAGTARIEGYGPARPSAHHRTLRAGRGQAPVPPIAVVTRSVELEWDSRFFTEAETRPIVITATAAPAARVRRAAEAADVIVAGTERVDVLDALAQLHRRGAGVVLCEGGPTLLGQVITAGALDELCLTVAPTLAANRAAGIVAGAALDLPTDLQLVSVLEQDGFLFLRYLTQQS